MVEPLKIKSNQFVKEQSGNIKDFYKITSCIGRGSPSSVFIIVGAYGEVRKCQHRDTKALRAVKIINKKNLEDEE